MVAAVGFYKYSKLIVVDPKYDSVQNLVIAVTLLEAKTRTCQPLQAK
jgi:hypothetical protein